MNKNANILIAIPDGQKAKMPFGISPSACFQSS